MDKYFTERLSQTSDIAAYSIGKEDLFDGKKFAPSFTWADNQNYYFAIQGLSLIHLLPPCWDSNRLNDWLNLVESVESELIKMRLYDKYSLNAISKNENLTQAYQLSSKAVDWTENHLEAPRTLREKTFYHVTDREINLARSMNYAKLLMTKCELMLKLDMKGEALEAIDQVVEHSNLLDIGLNDRIASFMMDCDCRKQAEQISRIAIEKGKASAKLKKLLSGGDESYNHNSIDSLASNHVKDKSDYLRSIMVNEHALPFDLQNLKGENVSLLDFKYKVVVLDFWATWCAPCIMSFHAYQQIIEKYKGDDEVVFLFINLDKDREDLEKEIGEFLTKRNFSFTVLLDQQGITSQSYSVSSLPTKFVINKNGIINFRKSGIKKHKEEMVEELSIMIELARKSEFAE